MYGAGLALIGCFGGGLGGLELDLVSYLFILFHIFALPPSSSIRSSYLHTFLSKCRFYCTPSFLLPLCNTNSVHKHFRFRSVSSESGLRGLCVSWVRFCYLSIPTSFGDASTCPSVLLSFFPHPFQSFCFFAWHTCRPASPSYNEAMARQHPFGLPSPSWHKVSYQVAQRSG